MEKKIYSLKINEKFASVTPPPRRCEREILEESLLQNGCEMPIIVWKGMIVDGHQRYYICREHRIPFAIQEMEFGSEAEAIVWIIKNQLGRRNLSSFQRCEMVLRFEPELKAEAEKHRREAISRYRSTGERSGGREDTQDILARMAGVSHGTLRNAKAICLSGDEVTKERLRNGEISIHYAYNSIFGRVEPRQLSEGERQRIMEALPIRDNDTGVDLSKIGDAVSSLREKVASGEASQKMMLEDLDHINSLIHQAGGF